MGLRGPKRTDLETLKKRGSCHVSARKKEVKKAQKPAKGKKAKKLSGLQDIIRLIPGYDPYVGADAYYFDYAAAEKAISFFHCKLKHVKGEKTGKPFILEPWEQAIVANIFGWKHKKTKLRRFKEVFIELGRKNGKTVLAAGLLLYLLFEDGEPGAEIYGAASEYKQASLVFTHAHGMLNQCSDLKDNAQVFKGQSKAIEVGEPGQDSYGIYRVISSDAFAAHGFSTHAAVIDELHTQPNADLVDAIQTSTGSRRQPLIIYITTSDYEREGSICNQKEEEAIKVRDGIINDPSFLPVIYKANAVPYTEIVESFNAIERMDEICTCKNVSYTQIERLWQEVCVKYAINIGLEKTKKITEKDVSTTQRGWLGQGGFVQLAMNRASSTATQNIKEGQSKEEQNGQKETKTKLERQTGNGEQPPKTKNTLSATGSSSCTEYPNSNTKKCLTSKEANVRFVAEKQNYALTIAMIRAKLEDFCVPNAIRELVFLEILKNAYEMHSPTCEVRKAKLNNSSLEIEHPADDWTEEATWRKANPNLGISVSLEYLQRECKRAQESPSYENTFKRLHLNIRTQQDIRWIQMSDWNKCGHLFDAAELTGQACYAGLDLSATRDITAFVLWFPDEKKVIPYFWLPAENIHEKEKEDGVSYTAWANQEFITLTPGNAVDYNVMMKDIGEICEKYDIRGIGFDRFGFEAIRQRLIGEGVPENKMIAFGQGFVSMSAPSKYFETQVLKHELNHGNNPILTWMASNVTAEMDAAGNIKPSKGKSKFRIDGIVSLIMAMGLATTLERKGLSVYETRGVLVA